MLSRCKEGHTSRIFIKEGWTSSTMVRIQGAGRAAPYFLVTLLFLSLLPTVNAAIGVSLSSSPTSQVVNPGENGSYTITVTNTGDEDMTVTLSTAQGQGCTGYTSTIEQLTGPVAGGGSETVTMTVTLTQNAEGSCDTTVTGTGTAPLNQPESGEVTVTTTAGDGSGGAVTGVDLTSADPDKTFAGNNPVLWTVSIENTGQVNETIQLSFESNATCDSVLTATVDPDIVQIDSGATEMVTVEVTVPEGTEAGSHCFYLKGVVTTPQTPEQASDFIQLYLEVPEMKECTATLSTASVQLDPSETGTYSITFYNDGNTDWTIGFSVNSAETWLTVSGGSTKLLPYQNGNGQAVFQFEVTPDDSRPAGELVDFTIQGLDGSVSKCSALFQVELGQSNDGTIQFDSARLDNVDPGSSRSVLLTAFNQGNGQETFSIAVTSASGWATMLDSNSVSLSGRHASSGSSASVMLQITAPEDALATDELTFDAALMAADGTTYATDTLTVTVAASRSMSASMPATEQFGKTGEISKFPLTFTNTGNIQDTFSLTVCDEPPSSNPSLCESPRWQARFSDESGSQVTSVPLAPHASVTVFAEITVEGEDEFESENFQVRVKNINDGTVQERFELKVIVSNHIYRMGIALESPGEIPDLQEVELPPLGETELWVIVTNTGTSSYTEEALISVSGMAAETKVTILHENGTEIGDSVQLEKDESIRLRVKIEIVEGVDNGATGIVQISAASSRNAAESSSVRISLAIRTNHEIFFEVDPVSDEVIEYGDVARVWVNVTNYGNVFETIHLLSSDPVRGWAIEVTEEEVRLAPGETRAVEVVVKPPTDLAQPDTLKFTLTAEPESSPVSAQPIDLSVQANPPTGIFASGGNLQVITLSIMGLLILAAVISALRSRREEQ